MKPFKLSVYILVLIIVLLSNCTSPGKKREDKIVNTKKILGSIDSLEEKAIVDTSIMRSRAYASKMEHMHIEVAKMERGLSEKDRLLLRYELALNSLRKYTVRLKKNSDLRQDKNFMAAVENEASKVRDCYRTLQNSSLTSVEKEKFDQLTHQKL